ncbi:hypothetical protein SUDANB58_00022 [Streptomyces sp. enrichment culture]
MALWDRIRESASTMQTQLMAKKNGLKSGAFRDASMAMCALVAAADGTSDPAERQRVAQLIATSEVLHNFDAADLRRRFEDNLAKLTADFAFGKVSVLQEIAKAKKKPAEARAVIQIGIVTDRLRSHRTAHREVIPAVEHRRSKHLNKWAGNGHQPARQREHTMKGLRSTGGERRFLSAFSGISPHVRPCRHLMTASVHRAETTLRFTIWDQVTGAGRPTTVERRSTTLRRTVRQSRTQQRDNALTCAHRGAVSPWDSASRSASSPGNLFSMSARRSRMPLRLP